MNSKERVMAVINHEKSDRIPVFGANCTITYEQMEKAKVFWPQAHYNGDDMAELAMATNTVLGFDAVRIPFSQTFEAEALGCKIKPGIGMDGQEGIPGIDEPPPYSLDDTPEFPDDFLTRGHIPELIKAIEIIKTKLGDEVAIVAGIVGPFTITGSLLGTIPFLKATKKTPEKLSPFLGVAEKAGTTLAKALIKAGADIISCEDMTASPMLIMPKSYYEIELEYQRRQFEAISVPKILHICGNVDMIVEWMGKTGADILSLEPKADLHIAREKCGPDVILMGGVDVAETLFMKDPESVKKECVASIKQGIQILAPGCAVAPDTTTDNLRAMVEVAIMN